MPAKVQVVHATSPLCSWSWGYEPVLARLERVYGDQIELVVGVAVPYVQREQWLKDYESTEQEAVDFEREVQEAIGVPVKTLERWGDLPESCIPGTFAVKAAGIVHGPKAERRLNRAIQFATMVEARDTANDAVLSEIIQKLGLDEKAIQKACAGHDVEHALEGDAGRLGHGANFYSLLVRDGEGTTVVLERAFEPARVESAIDWMGGGKLTKKAVARDVAAYARETGPVSLLEVQRVLGMTEKDAKGAIADAVKKGVLVEKTYKGVDGAFWVGK